MACTALRDDLIHNVLRRGMGALVRPGGTVSQPFFPLFLKALEPFVGRSDADTGRMRCFFHAQPLNKDAIHKQGSTARAQAGMFMQVHPGLLGAGLA
ncbi:hypothetical protein A7D17_07560 [Xanthomonas floridensis]|uniref:Uncharacterized protein n=1 Tax=Xanthomonas floridensis TaxID=1843580 RepID=A0A1A9M6P8_9XANT|nr:hypothetical protein A7D17_07560 [Xanthomonas floridensis]